MSSELIIKPQFLANVTDTGTENMSQYIVPPRIKVVQPTSTGVYSEQFTPGDMLLVPQNIKITGLTVDEKKRVQKTSDQIIFTPLFWFPEYCAWNPIQLRGTLPAIRERSFNPQSDIAKRARSSDLREIPCPEAPDRTIRYVEHLNFLILIHSEGLDTIPAVMGFSRAEHRTGSSFMMMIKMRHAPMYGCKFAMNVAARENSKGRWYGIDVTNPPENIGPFITEEAQFLAYQAQYLEFKKLHENSQIVVDHEDEDTVTLDQTVASEM